MELVAIEVRNTYFKCKSCLSISSVIKYETTGGPLCNKCVEKHPVRKRKSSYTHSIIGDYTKHSDMSISEGEKLLQRQLINLS